MSTTVVQEKEIMDALRQLEPVYWPQVLKFIDQLQNQNQPGTPTQQPQPLTAKQLLESDLVGLWADREEIEDSPSFARRLTLKPNSDVMIMLLLDTDILVDVFRKFEPALRWLDELGSGELGVPGLVAMELLQGCQNRQEQRRVERFLQSQLLYWPTSSDCIRAYAMFARFHLSHRLGMLDALIAATTLGLNATLATFNQKHYVAVDGLTIVQPYLRII